ncbi:MAG: TlpA family protein disulfide reductase [Planctomycetota bacterium]|jgi:thiol-disulfide isomerase/thioredoxin
MTATALVGLTLAGCADSSTSSAPEPPVPQQEAPKQPPAGDAVTVRVVDENELARAIEQRRGKVVLVDFWATWCHECLKLFPHTVELHEKLADRGLAVISVSMDDPDDEAAVLKRLKSLGATFDNFISRYGGSDRSVKAFGLEDLALPRYHVYDRRGELRTKLLGSIEAEHVDRAVEALLDES